MEIAKDEIFGPVMSIMKFGSIDEVVKRANDSNYGLAAGLVTKSLDTALHMSAALRVGTLYVNCFDVFTESTPFGGYKDSGIGREVGHLALNNYLETKNVIIKRPDGSLPWTWYKVWCALMRTLNVINSKGFLYTLLYFHFHSSYIYKAQTSSTS